MSDGFSRVLRALALFVLSVLAVVGGWTLIEGVAALGPASGEPGRASELPQKTGTNQAPDSTAKALESRIAELEERLLRADQNLVDLTAQFRPSAAPEKTEPAASLAVPIESEGTAKLLSFVSRFNQALREDGQNQIRLVELESVEPGKLHRAYFHRMGTSGVASGSVFAAEVEVTLPTTPKVIVLVARKGFEIERGQKSTLPDLGTEIELAPVDLARWRARVPELFSSRAGLEPSVGTKANVPTARNADATQRLASLFSSDASGWKLEKMGWIEEKEMREVELTQAAPAPGRKISAKRARTSFDDAAKTTELVLFEGTITRDGQSRPIPAAGFRILLSQVSPGAWKRALRGD